MSGNTSNPDGLTVMSHKIGHHLQGHAVFGGGSKTHPPRAMRPEAVGRFVGIQPPGLRFPLKLFAA